MPDLKIELQLTPEILPQNVVVEIADGGKYVMISAGEKPKETLAIGVKFRGAVYRWLPNERSLSNLVSTWGSDTSKWPGKKVQLWKKNKFMFGSQNEVIYGKPAEAAT